MTIALPKTSAITGPIEFLRHAFGQFTPQRPAGPANWPHFDLLFIHDGSLQLTLNQSEAVFLDAPQAILIHPHTPFTGQSHVVTTASVQHFSIRARASEPDALHAACAPHAGSTKAQPEADMAEDSDATDPPAGPVPQCFGNLLGKRAGFEAHPQAISRTIEHDVKRAVALAAHRPTQALYDTRVALLTLILTQLQYPCQEGHTATLQDARFGPLCNWLQDNLHRNISLQDMAAHAHLSPSHFRTLFRKRFNVSPGRAFLQMRMQHAADLLSQTVTPIKEIARQTGYDDSAHFHRAFKSAHGLTPNAYRHAHSPTG